MPGWWNGRHTALKMLYPQGCESSSLSPGTKLKRKLVYKMKGTRPFYIVSYTREYDGYESIIEYIGTNYKAALNRYIKLIEYIKQRDFLDENIAEDRIEQTVRLPEQQLLPGQSVYSYMNDNDCCYMSFELSCMNTGSFRTQSFEEKYKRDCPNAKY